jgi:hypothetical protein
VKGFNGETTLCGLKKGFPEHWVEGFGNLLFKFVSFDLLALKILNIRLLLPQFNLSVSFRIFRLLPGRSRLSWFAIPIRGIREIRG